MFSHRTSASLFVLGFLGTLFTLAAPVARLQAQQPAGNIENGKERFKVHGCTSCHGYSGQGGAGARLAQNPITLEAFKNYVRRPKGSMPPFGNQLTEAEFADIYAYLKSVPPSPDPKTIPLLNERD
jgi:mono/diheme cytochrome c family protein